jgi:hypothetical protein
LGLLYKPGKKVTAAMDFASVAILIWNCQLFGAQNQLKIRDKGDIVAIDNYFFTFFTSPLLKKFDNS